MRPLAIIPARGGSKGIPGKNIKELGGKPLIAYTIESAIRSKSFDRIILSTDSLEIAEVGRRYGAEVPFIQPEELAQDHVPMLDVVRHALNWLKENENYEPAHIMILQPTTPLRQAFHIQESIELMNKVDSDSVLAVSEIPGHYSPYKAMVVDDENMLKLFNGDPVYKRVSLKQHLKKTYRSTGMIFLFKIGLVLDLVEPNLYGERVVPYVVESKYVVDIDTPEDWGEAERLLAELN